MGGVRSFRIESKRFDLIREGDGVDAVSLLETGRYMRHLVTMGKAGARWLGKCIEENIVRETEQAFVRTFREQDKGYVIRRFENKRGRYLEIADYGRGGCKGRLDIPEGQKQSGWRGFNKELTLLLNPIPVVNKGHTNSDRGEYFKKDSGKGEVGAGGVICRFSANSGDRKANREGQSGASAYSHFEIFEIDGYHATKR
jgi:hypothetical protein